MCVSVPDSLFRNHNVFREGGVVLGLETDNLLRKGKKRTCVVIFHSLSRREEIRRKKRQELHVISRPWVHEVPCSRVRTPFFFG